MTIDHYVQFFPSSSETLRWVGRISIPIFMYCIVIGYNHTSNKKKYLVRLYLASITMALINLLINYFYNTATDLPLENNFFATLFMTAVIVHVLYTKKVKLYLFFFAWQIISFSLCIFLVIITPNVSYRFYGAILGNMIFIEGGVFILLLGVIFYLFQSKKSLVISYSIYCLFIYMIYHKFGGTPAPFSYFFLPFAKYQWMMIIALPFLLLYNGKKGMGIKHLFYFYYPIHILIFYFLSTL